MRSTPLALVLLLVATPAAAQADSTWRDHTRAAESARTARDWAGYRAHLLRAREIAGMHPALSIGLARAEARLGDSAAAYAHLRDFATMGMSRDLARDADLASLAGTPAWTALTERIAANARPVGRPEAVFSIADSAFIPEDLVRDEPRGRWLVSSVHHGIVARIDAHGARAELVPHRPDEGWAMQGLAIDPVHGDLWVASTALPQGPAFPAADSGRAAVLRYDLASGALRRRYDLPRDGVTRAPGDLTVAENGDVFIGDGQAGAVYVIRSRSDRVETLVAPGVLRSAQQPAVLPDGRRLVVPDWSRGLAMVDRRTGAVSWLRTSGPIALTGIDGLMVHGHALIGFQNGTNPQRVVLLEMSNDWTTVTGLRALAQNAEDIREPTHGVVIGDDLYFIANSGWDALNDDGSFNPQVPLRPARILRLPLR